MNKQDKTQRDEMQRHEVDEEKVSILTHLNALRRMLMISAGTVLAAFVLIFYLCIDWLMSLITGPISARGVELIYTAMSEALMTKPALYSEERRMFRLLFFIALILFLVGVVFCYFAVYYLAVDFFIISGENLATPMLSIDKYVNFLFGFLLPFGIAFQLPVAMFITTRMGWTDSKSLASKRKYVILGLAVAAAILTPPDVVSQLMLLIPMCVLFELGVIVSKTVKPRVRPEDDEEA